MSVETFEGFETESMPIEVTIIAEQNDYRLMPIHEDGKANYILFDTRVDVDEVLSHIEEEENMDLQWSRIVCGICVFVGMMCRIDDNWPFEVGIGGVFDG